MLFPAIAHAQDLQFSLDSLNGQRLHTNRVGMSVLGGWAVANIGFSGVQYFRTEGQAKGFHQMNVMWNFVNLGLAATSLIGSGPESALGLGMAESLAEQQKIEKILLFNAGLDVGYVMAGFYLRERSLNPAVKKPDRMRGWGNSLLLQGGFLFAFDITMVLLHNHHGSNGIMKLLQTVHPVPGGLGMVIPIH
jgi:hypothetical protein